MLSSQLFGKFFNFFRIGFLIVGLLWNQSFVATLPPDTVNTDGIYYTVDHIELNEDEYTVDRPVNSKTICSDPLYQEHAQKDLSVDRILITSNELDELLYSLLHTINDKEISIKGIDNLSLKNYPEVVRLYMENTECSSKTGNFLIGKQLNIKCCNDNKPNTKKALWIKSMQIIDYPTYNEIQQMTTPAIPEVPKLKDCSDELVFSDVQINSLISKALFTILRKYKTDREDCKKTTDTQETCLCTLNSQLKTRTCVEEYENAMKSALRVNKEQYRPTLQYVFAVSRVCKRVEKILQQ